MEYIRLDAYSSTGKVCRAHTLVYVVAYACTSNFTEHCGPRLQVEGIPETRAHHTNLITFVNVASRI